MIKRFKKLLGIYRNSSVLVLTYRSYGTAGHIYIPGRVLDNRPLLFTGDDSLSGTLRNSFKQFDSYEIRYAPVELRIKNVLQLETKADGEGYFLFDEEVEKDLSEFADEEGWVNFDVDYRGAVNSGTELLPPPFEREFLIPEKEAEYGVISDIDDTILHTDVNSFLKLKLLKNSLITNAYRRLPLAGAPELYRKFHFGRNGKNKNPVFYLSNSPWNLYEYLKLFLDHNDFPKGPILLRNFHTPWDRIRKPEKPHKQKEIINILKTYPELDFILIGDSGEHDAAIYTEIAVRYPQRIKAIYLRSVKHKGRMRKVQKIIDNFRLTPVLMVRSSEEAEFHARKHGFIR